MGEPVLVRIPQETVNDVSVRVVGWNVESGSRVKEGQLICEVETSKAVMEITAPAAGVIHYSAAEGDEIPVGSVICRIVSDNGRSATGQSVASETAAKEAPASQSDPDQRPARFTPLAAKVAAELGIDPAEFAPGTLVRRVDVLEMTGGSQTGGATPVEWGASKDYTRASPEAGQNDNASVSGVQVNWEELPRRKLVEGRILGAGRANSLQSSITTLCRAPALGGAPMAQSSAGLSPLVVFQVARILRQFPAFNAVYSRGRVGYYEEVNVGWAIDGGHGLVVPVVKGADQKGYRAIEAIMEQHIEAYIENKLAPIDFLGGTFTVTDLSADGVSLFQPLISQGQSAILGIGSDALVSGEEVLYLTLAFDHQIGEGRLAAHFLRELRKRLESHDALEVPKTSTDRSTRELHCVLCQRDGETLLSLKAALVRSELPPGCVCSICLRGF